MKQRVISSMVGLLILALVLALIKTKLYNIAIAALSMMALFEMLRAVGCIKNKGLAVLSFAMSLVMPFVHERPVLALLPQILFVFFILFFALLVKNSTTTRIEQTAMAFMFSVFIPLFFSCAVFLRDIFGAVSGCFYLLLALGSAWLCDSGAYFVGLKYGKRKLAPIVSPKKTVEGAIGGLVLGTVFMILIAFLFGFIVSRFGVSVRINYVLLALITPICGVIGMLGDLSASVIKRQFYVKDYGDIMPGHGGVMDRFDSVMFTLPAVFIIAQQLNVKLFGVIFLPV